MCGLRFAATEAFTKEETRVQTLGAGVERVIVHADAGDVRLVGSTEPRVTVRSESRWLLRKPRVTASRRGEVLVLRGGLPAAGAARALRRGLRGRGALRRRRRRWTATPATSRSTTWPATSACAPTPATSAGSGLQPATVRVHTDAGDVGLAFDTQPALVDAFSDAGDVSITVPEGEYRIDTATDAGDVTLDGVLRNDRAVRRIVAETAAGDVTIRGRG